MPRSVRQIQIPGVGGPFIETTVDAPFEGASSDITVERGPGYREPLMIRITAVIGASFALGLVTGVLLPVWAWS